MARIMRIGFSSPVNTSVLMPFVESTVEQQKIKQLGFNSKSPSVDTLVVSLIKKGHFVRIFTMGHENYSYTSPKFDLFIIKANTNYIVRNSWSVFDKSKRIRKVINNNYNDLDIIHSHWTYEYTDSLREISSRIPVVCTVRDWAPYIWKFVAFKDKLLWAFKYIMAQRVFACSHIYFVANSPYTADLLKRKGKDAPIIPNSISDSFFEDITHIYPEHLEILCISSSDDKRKNIISLLRAFKIVRNKHPNAVLSLVGGCFTNKSQNYSKYLSEGLLEGVELCGHVDHDKLKYFLDKSTMFVTPSLEETFGNTLLESIARKVPTVGGKDSGAVPYVLHYGEAGFLCDVKNPLKIVETIEYITDHIDEASVKADKAYEIIRMEYSESNVANMYINLYSKAIQKKKDVD